jgi:4-hydroxy-tetrahydrodipicolinate synthase
MNQLFRGAGVALVTPFDSNEDVDFDALGHIIENQVKGGMDYLVALGTTAETPTLDAKEKSEVVEFIKKRSSGLPVVVGLGGNDTRSALKQMENFDFDGVSGLLVVTPYYNRPSQDGMHKHYSEIAKKSPVPIILYNVPPRTGVNLEAETVVRLANEFENIVAVKEASGNMQQISNIEKDTHKNFSVISGDDGIALPVISVGGKGVISVIANALPEKLSQLIHFALENNYTEARKIHFELSDILKLLFKEGNPCGVKALMNIQGTIKNELRSPMYKVSEPTYNQLKEAYQRFL